MRTCSSCKISKPLTEYNDTLTKKQSLCRECNKAYQKAHYIQNKPTYISNKKAREKANHDWLKEYKSTLQCSRCPENNPVCLDFHHRDPETKLFGIGNDHYKVSLKKLQEEIAKCDVLCANCHRKEHATVV